MPADGTGVVISEPACGFEQREMPRTWTALDLKKTMTTGVGSLYWLCPELHNATSNMTLYGGEGESASPHSRTY